jgi:hypothetical protein
MTRGERRRKSCTASYLGRRRFDDDSEQPLLIEAPGIRAKRFSLSMSSTTMAPFVERRPSLLQFKADIVCAVQAVVNKDLDRLRHRPSRVLPSQHVVLAT